MAKVEVSRRFDATPAEVWDVLADLSGHVSWMEDARAITFTSALRSGAGTEFDCDTVIGPIRLVDHMRVTEWEPGEVIAIRHVKPVVGTGRITLAPAGDDRDEDSGAEPAASETGGDEDLAPADGEVPCVAERFERAPPRVTVVTWSEELTLPLWLGGRAGGVVAARILHRVWGRSLANLERLVEERRRAPGA